MSPYQLFRTGLGIIKDNSSSLAFGFGIGMSIVTVYEAIKAPSSPKQVLEEAAEKKKKEKGEETTLTTVEKGVVITKTYSKVIAPYVLCLLGFGYSKKSDLEAIGTLGTMLAFEKQQSKLFEDKAVELLGEKKVEEVREAVADEQLKQNPPPQPDDPNAVSCPWLYNPLTASYLRMPIATFKEKVTDYNMDLMNEVYKSYNEFHVYYLHQQPLDVLGDGVGYNININGKMEVDVLWRTIDGMNVGVLKFTNPPVRGYMSGR